MRVRGRPTLRSEPNRIFSPSPYRTKAMCARDKRASTGGTKISVKPTLVPRSGSSGNPPRQACLSRGEHLANNSQPSVLQSANSSHPTITPNPTTYG